MYTKEDGSLESRGKEEVGTKIKQEGKNINK